MIFLFSLPYHLCREKESRNKIMATFCFICFILDLLTPYVLTLQASSTKALPVQTNESHKGNRNIFIVSPQSS